MSGFHKEMKGCNGKRQQKRRNWRESNTTHDKKKINKKKLISKVEIE